MSNRERKVKDRETDRNHKRKIESILIPRQWDMEYDIDGNRQSLYGFRGHWLGEVEKWEANAVLDEDSEIFHLHHGRPVRERECYSLPQSDAEARYHSDGAPSNWPTETSMETDTERSLLSRTGTELTFWPHHFQQDTSLWFHMICFSHWRAHTCQSTHLAGQKHTSISFSFFHFFSFFLLKHLWVT